MGYRLWELKGVLWREEGAVGAKESTTGNQIWRKGSAMVQRVAGLTRTQPPESIFALGLLWCWAGIRPEMAHGVGLVCS